MTLLEALTDDLRREPWRGHPNPLAGHCYVASEAAHHLLKRMGIDSKPMFIRHEGAPHWFLMLPDGVVLDLTADQFTTPVPYGDAKGKGFLTLEPSARAAEVLRRMGVAN